MTVVSEIKDTALCTMSMDHNIKELHKGWQIALAFLNILRSHFFLLPLMGAIPVVVLTQGGSAMSICFNTITILFITLLAIHTPRNCSWGPINIHNR
jgi:hypothetical protein